MTYEDIAPFLWFGFSCGCLAGWLGRGGLDRLEAWLIKRVTRRAHQPSAEDR